MFFRGIRGVIDICKMRVKSVFKIILYYIYADDYNLIASFRSLNSDELRGKKIKVTHILFISMLWGKSARKTSHRVLTSFLVCNCKLA